MREKRPTSPQKTLLLHLGTHKTGTKTLQVFVSANRAVLEAGGIHVVRGGRLDLGEQAFTPGQHRLAWEVIHNQADGARAEILSELSASPSPVAVISSEDLEYLAHYPGALDDLKRDFESVTYRVVALVSLRRQDSYLESMYGQFIRGSVVRPLSALVDEVLRTGLYDAFASRNLIAFDYLPFLTKITSIFGEANVIAWPWRANPDPLALPTTFLRVAARFVPGGLNLSNLVTPAPFANPRDTLRVMLDHVRSTLGDKEVPAVGEIVAMMGLTSDVLDRPFTALSRAETLQLLDRFASSNLIVKSRWGCDIGFDSLDHIAPVDHPHWVDAAQQRAVLDTVLDRWLR